MNTSSEAAEQVVRMELQGVEFGLKVTGKMAKEIAAFLIALSKDKTKVKGRTTLNNMLKSGQPLKVFSVKSEDFKKFCEEAKKYGILYSALIDKRNKDGVIDIMVMEKDANKINRIVDRFNFATYNKADIKSEIYEEEKQKASKDKGVQVKDSKVKEKENAVPNKEKQYVDPNLGKTERNPQSVTSSDKQRSSKNEGKSINKKRSVREDLKKYKEIVKEKDKQGVEKLDKVISPKKVTKER